MAELKVWDRFIRVFHWMTVGSFALNALVVDDDSMLHQQLGWLLVGLVVARLIWGVVGRGYARFSSFPLSLSGAVEQVRDMLIGRRVFHAGHTPLGAWMIWNLLLTLLVIGLSGYFMTSDRFWGQVWPEVMHRWAVTWAEFSVLVHVAAVCYESARMRVNLIRAMITGTKILPDSNDDRSF